MNVTGVFFHACGDAGPQSLAELFRLLITVDAAVLQNAVLQSAWADYKMMMQFVRADPEKFGLPRARLTHFERLLAHLDASVLRGMSFRGCVEQNFEEMAGCHPRGSDSNVEAVVQISVRSSETLLAELLCGLRQTFERTAAVLGTNSETCERRTLVGIYGLYAFYRTVTPPNAEPDPKLYRQLWSLQRRLPVVTLCGRLVWFVADFMLEVPLPCRPLLLSFPFLF